MDVVDYLPTEKLEKSDVVNDGDYVGDDGLWHCGVCGKAKQKKIDSPWMRKTVWCICDCRKKELEEEKRQNEYDEEMRMVQRLKDASMMSDKYRKASFSSYIEREENKKVLKIAKSYAEEFRQMITEGHPVTGEKNVGLIFFGQVGTGKSYTAACIANYLLEKKISVIMTSFVKILQDIQKKDDEAEYVRILNSCSLLVIDDLGAERNTDYALEKVYNIIDSRARADKPMILTTNLSFDEMMQNPDIRYKRIYDRIFEHCMPVEITGKSFRIMRAAQRQRQLKGYYD